jgi:hypothetical protein
MAKKTKKPVRRVSSTPDSGVRDPDPDESSIAALAHQLWMARGCPAGSDQQDWFRAESMLKHIGKLE